MHDQATLQSFPFATETPQQRCCHGCLALGTYGNTADALQAGHLQDSQSADNLLPTSHVFPALASHQLQQLHLDEVSALVNSKLGNLRQAYV